MARDQGWQSEQVLAWTDREGPGRPPAGSQKLVAAIALLLGAAFVGIVSSDTLCPEHRAWVDTLGIAALFGAGASITGLVRQWAAAPLLALASAVLGVAIGLIDAVHAPERGRLIAGAFGLVVLAVSALSFRFARLAWWERRVVGDLASVAPSVDAPRPIEAVEDAEDASSLQQ